MAIDLQLNAIRAESIGRRRGQLIWRLEHPHVEQCITAMTNGPESHC